MQVLVNGNQEEDWKIDGQVLVDWNQVEWELDGRVLPPNGWLVRAPQREHLTAFSMLVDGHRADYVDSPAYIYADGRGTFTRFARAACDRQLVVLPRSDGSFELIPVGPAQSMAVSLGDRPATAQALDEAGKALGPAETRLARGLVHVMPVAKAFSYIVTPHGEPSGGLDAWRDRMVPGETITFCALGPIHAPADARPGSRLWLNRDGLWLDFGVVPLADAELKLDGTGLRLRLLPHMVQPTEADVTFNGSTRHVRLAPEEPLEIAFPLAAADREKRAVQQLLPSPLAGEGLGVRGRSERDPQLFMDGREERKLVLHVAAGPLVYDRTWRLKRSFRADGRRRAAGGVPVGAGTAPQGRDVFWRRAALGRRQRGPGGPP